MKPLLMLRILALILLAPSSLIAQEQQAISQKKYSPKEILLKILLPSASVIALFSIVFYYASKEKRDEALLETDPAKKITTDSTGKSKIPLKRTPSTDETDTETQEKNSATTASSTLNDTTKPSVTSQDAPLSAFGNEKGHLGDEFSGNRKRRSSNAATIIPILPVIEEIQPTESPTSISPIEMLTRTISRNDMAIHSPPQSPSPDNKVVPARHISRARNGMSQEQQTSHDQTPKEIVSPNAVRKTSSVDSLPELRRDQPPPQRQTSSQPTLQDAAKLRLKRRKQFAKAVADKLDTLPFPESIHHQESSIDDQVLSQSLRSESADEAGPESADDDRDSCSSAVNSPRINSPSLFSTI